MLAKRRTFHRVMNSNSEDEADLWAAALDGVQPLPAAPRSPPPPKRVDGALKTAADEAAVMPDALDGIIDPDELDTGEEAEYRRPGVNRAQMRRLRRGEFAIQATIDLHGQTRAEAAQSVRSLLDEAQRRGWRCIKIIHGKGNRSPGGQPVLKSRVEVGLRRNDQVLAYASAPPWSGGHGAILALLRGPR